MKPAAFRKSYIYKDFGIRTPLWLNAYAKLTFRSVRDDVRLALIRKYPKSVVDYWSTLYKKDTNIIIS
jgi:hypothetical protein